MKKTFFGLFFLFFASLTKAVGQCAMCRATVENNVNNGEIGIASSLNFGIMYLFAAPYIIVAVIGFFWYRNSKKQGRKISIS